MSTRTSRTTVRGRAPTTAMPIATRQSARRRTELPSEPQDEGLEISEAHALRQPSPPGEENLPSNTLENSGILIPEISPPHRNNAPDERSESMEALDLATIPSHEALMVPGDGSESIDNEEDSSNESDNQFNSKDRKSVV